MRATMKRSFPIIIRQYDEHLAIAETAGPYHFAAAGASASDAIARLELTLVDRLERTHPTRLGSVATPGDLRRIEAAAPLYRNRTDVDGVEPHLPSEVEAVVETYGESLRRLWLPSFGLARWHVPGRGRDDSEDTEAWLEEAAKAIRDVDYDPAYHRRIPSSIELDVLELDFEPLDPADAIEEAFHFGPLADPVLERGETSETPTLERIADRWTRSNGDTAKRTDLQPVVGRRELVAQLREFATAPHPDAVLLVGAPRVGKTALMRHLAWETSSGGDSSRLGGRNLWFADAARLTSLRSPMGSWREQCNDVIEELETSDDLLYLGRLIQTLDAGKSVQSRYSLAHLLKPVLDDRRIRLFAEATPAEWNEIERRNPGLARTFQVVRVGEPPEKEGLRILTESARRIGKRREIDISDAAIERIWRLHNRFATTGAPFGRSVDFADRMLRRADQAFREEVDSAYVVHHFCRETGLPEEMLRDDQTLDLAAVRRRLSERVMGQPAATERVADVIGVTKADLGAPNRPLGVFFFVGPTGVGKTELAKALADYMFGDEKSLIRLDMSEYSSPGAFGRLTGEGHGEGDLTGPVRRQPFCVVLLDEIEKAHSGVYDLLLQVFGEARLTDAQGRTTPFQNSVVVMTSNLGVESQTSSIGFEQSMSVDAWETHFRSAAEDYFRPEFLGRVDQFVPFRPLPMEVVADIASRELGELEGRIGPRQLGVDIDITPDVPKRVAELGWNERYGARPIKRVVEQQIAWPLADRVARDSEEEGRPSRVTVDVTKGEGFDFDVEYSGESRDTSSNKESLARQVEMIAELRRRVRRYVESNLFSRLEMRVEDYDHASRRDEFWENTDVAAEQARQAEQARELVEPARELVDEICALEDLAREAYHDRSVDMAADVEGQVGDYANRVDDLFLELIGTHYEDPDEIVLFFPSEHPEDPWRNELVEYYQALGEYRGWKTQLWQGIPAGSRKRSVPVGGEFDRSDLWRTQRSPQGRVVAMTFRGRAVRAFLAREAGRHRCVKEEEAFVCSVAVLPPHQDWPHPDSFRDRAAAPQQIRTWNFVEETVKTTGYQTVPLDEDSPWEELFEVIKRRAWEVASWS